ncbi:MAG TPA: hypothetical protein VHY56_13720 [Candidatus Binataceae bacterium]|nr:hypothetical protein [Candidatus Binataceae bacterium]
MKAPARNIMVMATAAIAVVVVRTGLPVLLTRLINAAVRKIPGIRGKVRRMQIKFLTPGVELTGVSVAMLDTPGHRAEVGVIALNSQWKDLLRGALVASLRVKAPRLVLNIDGVRGAHADDKKQKPPSDKAGPRCPAGQSRERAKARHRLGRQARYWCCFSGFIIPV